MGTIFGGHHILPNIRMLHLTYNDYIYDEKTEIISPMYGLVPLMDVASWF